MQIYLPSATRVDIIGWKIALIKLGSTAGAVAELRTELSEVRKSAAEKSSTVQCEVLSEIKDREERKHNVIMIGLKESTAVEKAEVQAEENDHLNNLFTDMQLNPETTSQRIKVGCKTTW